LFCHKGLAVNDLQIIFNIAVALSGALGGWILKTIWDAIKSLDADVKALGQRMHHEFVRRDDFKESTQELKSDMRAGFAEVKSLIGEVFSKLDNKADK